MTIFESLLSQELASKLADVQIQEVIDDNLDLILAENSAGTAFMAVKKLEPALKQNKLPGDIQAKYENYLVRLKFQALTKLRQDDAGQLLSSKLVSVMKSDINVEGKIRQVFAFPDPDDFKKVDWMLRSFEANNELLISNVVFPDGKSFAGTVGNILRLYKSSPYFVTGGSLGISNFLTNDKNIKQASPEALENVRRVLSLYEWVRLKAAAHEEFNRIDEDIGTSLPAPQAQPQPKPESKQEDSSTDLTAFEKRLAEISAQHPKEVDQLAKKMEEAAGSKVAPVVAEIKKEIEVAKAPQPVRPAPPPSVPPLGGEGSSNMNSKAKFVEELLKAPVEMKELPEGKPELKPQAKPQPRPQAKPTSGDSNFSAQPKISKTYRFTPKPIPEPTAKADVVGNIGPMTNSLNDIRMIDDLKKIEPGHLRQGGGPKAQVELIKNKMIGIIKAQKVLPYYVVLAFEQSPVYQAYLSLGNKRMSGGQSSVLSQEEFEALADLKRQIESL